MRVEKIVNGKTTRYLYEYDKIVLELDEKGRQTARNVHGINPISRTVDGATAYYMYNGHADVTALIDESGTILGTYYYDAFGNIEETTGTADNPFAYAGYQYDKETGLYYLNSRMYDPKIARFMQEDSYRGDFKDPLSLNLYSYCHNEPIMYWDPTGHMRVNESDLDKETGSSTSSNKGSGSSTGNKTNGGTVKTSPKPSASKSNNLKMEPETPVPMPVKNTGQVSEKLVIKLDIEDIPNPNVAVASRLAITGLGRAALSEDEMSKIEGLFWLTMSVMSKFMPLVDNPRENLETMPYNEEADTKDIEDLPVAQNSKPNLIPFPIQNRDEDRGVPGIPLRLNTDKYNLIDIDGETGKTLSQDWQKYFDEIEFSSGRKLSQTQKDLIIKEIEVNPHNQKLTGQDYKDHRAEFNNQKSKLIADWEKSTGQTWPTYTEDIVDKNGDVYIKSGDKYDAHEIIPNVYNSPLYWWNLHPLARPIEHQSSIHGIGSAIKSLFK